MKIRLSLLALLALVFAASCNQPYSPTKVTSITVTAAGGTTTTFWGNSIHQFSAKVLPTNASDLSVTWSVTDVSGNMTTDATIDANGILTVSSNPSGLEIIVVATANDGSGISGSITVSVAAG